MPGEQPLEGFASSGYCPFYMAAGRLRAIPRTGHYSVFGIAVDRRKTLKWLFPQEKATFHNPEKVYVYSENALRMPRRTVTTGSARLRSARTQGSNVLSQKFAS